MDVQATPVAAASGGDIVEEVVVDHSYDEALCDDDQHDLRSVVEQQRKLHSLVH